MKLFKYVSANRIDILKNQYIRFSQQYALNDPFEGLPFYTDNSGKWLDYSWNHESQKVESKPNKNLLTWFINHNFVSLSLTTKNDNLLMWSHYASNHTGFVIELETDHLFFNDPHRHLYQVPYEQIRPGITLKECEQLVAEISSYLKGRKHVDEVKIKNLIQLFSKSHHWAYEDEWRLLTVPELSVNYNEKEHGYIIRIGREKPIGESFSSHYCALFHLPADCIKSIYCGARISTESARYLYFAIRNNPIYSHIDLNLATIDDAEFKLGFRPLTEHDILTIGEAEYERNVKEGKRKRIDPKWYHISYAASYEREKRRTILNSNI